MAGGRVGIGFDIEGAGPAAHGAGVAAPEDPVHPYPDVVSSGGYIRRRIEGSTGVNCPLVHEKMAEMNLHVAGGTRWRVWVSNELRPYGPLRRNHHAVCRWA